MRYIKHLFMAAVGILSLIYLLNPGAGIIEFIPDNLPIVGNLDEAFAAFLLLNCLAYFGLDLRNLVSAKRQMDPKAIGGPQPPPRARIDNQHL